MIRTIDALISRGGVNFPQGDLSISAPKGLRHRYFASRSGREEGPLTRNAVPPSAPRGIGPPFEIAKVLQARCPWLCTPCQKYRRVRVTRASRASTRGPAFSSAWPSLPRRVRIEITSWRSPFYCRFLFNATRPTPPWSGLKETLESDSPGIRLDLRVAGFQRVSAPTEKGEQYFPKNTKNASFAG